MANKVLLVAVNNEQRSTQFSVYATKEGKLPKQFVMSLEDSVNQNGEPEVRLSNASLGLIKSNTVPYTENLLKGFRKKHEERVFVVVEPFNDHIPSANALSDTEAF